MRWFARCLCSCSPALLACASPADRPADTAAVASAAAKTPLALADVAGRWKVRANNYRGDSLTVYELNATRDTSGWTITFPNRPPLPLQIIAVAGDSIVTETGPYPSVLRTSVGVRSLRAVNRLEGDQIVGSFTARYQTTEPDSVLHGVHVGTRMK
jgi:hypothetical protein